MRRSLLLALLSVASSVVALGPAWAHTGSPPNTPAAVVPLLPSSPEALSTATPGVAAPWAALAVLTVVSLASVCRRRRAVALTLTLVIALFAVETGVHSAHHLGRPDDAARCSVASAASHVSGDVTAVEVTVVPISVDDASSLGYAAPAPTARAVAPDIGRAPPVPSA